MRFSRSGYTLSFLTVSDILVNLSMNAVCLRLSCWTKTASSPKMLALMMAPKKRPKLEIYT